MVKMRPDPYRLIFIGHRDPDSFSSSGRQERTLFRGDTESRQTLPGASPMTDV